MPAKNYGDACWIPNRAGHGSCPSPGYDTNMQPTPELIDDIYLQKVLRARATPIEEKLLEGFRLYAYACEAVRAGVRAQNPNASPEELKILIRERFERIRLVEEML